VVGIIGVRRLILLLAAALVVGAAQASPGHRFEAPTITRVAQARRFVQVEWTVPAGYSARLFEIGSAPDTDASGGFVPAALAHRETLRAGETGIGPGYQLSGGVYFIQVGATPAACGSCAVSWSAQAQLRVPQNTRPAITFAQFALSDHDTEGAKTPAVWASLQACDDTTGNVRPVIEEVHVRGGRVDRRQRLVRALYLSGVPCPGRQLISWPITRRLRAPGQLIVRLHVIDPGGKSSSTVTHTWPTSLIPVD
jgi:hypothetical protein